MKLIGFESFYLHRNGTLAESHWTLIFKISKKKKVRITLDTVDVIHSLGLEANSSPDLISEKLSDLLGRCILFHSFSVLSF